MAASASMLEIRPAIVLSSHYSPDASDREIDAGNQDGHSTVNLFAPTKRDTTENEPQVMDSEDKLLIESLKQRFLEQYDEKTDPKIALQIVQRSKKFDEDDFWLCFCLAYPRAASRIMTMRSQLNALYSLLNYRHKPSIYLHCTSVDEWRWPFLSISRPSYNGGYPGWSSKKVQILKAVSEIHKEWSTLGSDLQNILEPIGEFDGMVERLNELVKFFQEEVRSIEMNVEEETRRLAEGMLLLWCALWDDHC
jgi:hypothetical protein